MQLDLLDSGLLRGEMGRGSMLLTPHAGYSPNPSFPLPEQGKVPIERLRQYATGWLARVDAAQQGLRGLLSAAIQQHLAAAHWPPKLAVSGEGAAAAGAGDNGGAWRGFAAAGDAAVAELQQLLVVLVTLQRASQHEQFSALSEANQEGPLLWAAEELAAPLAERLRHHFAGRLWLLLWYKAAARRGRLAQGLAASAGHVCYRSLDPSFRLAGGLPTDRPDRPEWLFATAIKAAQQCAPLAEELQPCIGERRTACRLVAEGVPSCARHMCLSECAQHLPPGCAPLLCSTSEAHQLHAWYSMPLEVARAVQAVGVNTILSDHLLPQVSPAAALLALLLLCPCSCSAHCLCCWPLLLRLLPNCHTQRFFLASGR